MNKTIIFDPLGELLKVAKEIEQLKEQERGSQHGLRTQKPSGGR